MAQMIIAPDDATFEGLYTKAMDEIRAIGLEDVRKVAVGESPCRHEQEAGEEVVTSRGRLPGGRRARSAAPTGPRPMKGGKETPRGHG